jgi:hypothetical protein
MATENNLPAWNINHEALAKSLEPGDMDYGITRAAAKAMKNNELDELHCIIEKTDTEQREHILNYIHPDHWPLLGTRPVYPVESIEKYEQQFGKPSAGEVADVLYLITHEHKEGITPYTAVRKSGEVFDLDAFIEEEGINFEPETGESINYEILELPEGFTLARTGGQDPQQAVVNELVGLIDGNNDNVVEGLDDLIHDLYDNAASNINNGGVHKQIKHIVFELGAEEARKKITTMTQDQASTQGPK